MNSLKRSMVRGTLLTFSLLIFSAAGLPAAGSAATPAAPAWLIGSTSNPSAFSPGDFSPGPGDKYVLLATNVGGAPTDGSTITLTDTLPAGLSFAGGPFDKNGYWTCGTAGQTATCTLDPSLTIGALAQAPALEIPVSIDPSVLPDSTLTNSATVSGGGATGASTSDPTGVNPPTPPPFALQALSSYLADAAGAPDTQAADHPNSLTASFEVTNVSDPNSGRITNNTVLPETPKDVVFDLPIGFVGNPQAAPRCPFSDLVANSGAGTGVGTSNCPAASQVGTVALDSFSNPIQGPAGSFDPGNPIRIFNMIPEHGFPAEFALSYASYPLAMYPNVVGNGAGAHLRVTIPSIPAQGILGVQGSQVTFFGNPASQDGGATPPTAFFTNPSDCSGQPLTTTIHIDSYENRGARNPNGTPDFSDPAWKSATTTTPPVTGCNLLHFNPSLSLQPDTSSADSPAGVNVDLQLSQNTDPNGHATPELKDATVTLPQGLTVNPSTADGLAGCTDAQIDIATNDPPSCPLASQIGTATVHTPLLDHALPGKVYLGAPSCAPCSNADAAVGKLINLYIEVNDPITGVIVKLPGSGAVDPSTGQITASFTENPQLPFEDLNLTFKGGPRATLTTPPTCGHYITTTDLKPWSAPQSGPDATPQSGFDLTSGPNASACASTEAGLSNSPSFEAGTVTPIAGSYSPFVLKLTRENGSQRIAAIDTTLPQGLTGKLAGIPYCSDAQIAAAAAHSGAAEKASPSCPLASEVGVVNVGAGSGAPFYVQGHAYLAGPYKGAPLSLAIITPAVAGPFDLGTVVVRTALYVNETTAQIHAVSDPIPTILAGVPLDVRSIALNMNRPNFTLNPTNCEAMAVTGEAISTTGAIAPLSNRFQVGGCDGLGFKPDVAIHLKGSTKRAGNPALRATVTYPKKGSYANIARAQVTLPKSEFLDNAHIRTVCTRVQFAAAPGNGSECPAASVYGHARATTPLLDKPLEGPVFLRSSSHKLPDLVAALNGQISIALAGRIDTGKGGGIRNTFEVVPDAPVSKFVLSMQGGEKGLLVNSENLCSPKAKTHAVVNLTAQNGKLYDTTPAVQNSCKKSKGGKKGKGHKHHAKGSAR